MKYVLNLTGKNLNEIYAISLPKNLINFIRYDFTPFMERSVDLCKLYMKTGEYRAEEVVEIRNSISGCHKYYEHNMRTIFDKIVVDCWIEFICRQGEIGILTLWNNYIPCRNEFEKVVFARINEYRHNLAINQWVNILRIQEYALRKVNFVFGAKVKNPNEAAAKSAYFDLMFNVTANEMGFDITNIAESTISSSGRTPNSPFTMSNVSREIIRNVLNEIQFDDEPKFPLTKNPYLSDQLAMDAFSGMKSFLPDEPDNIINTMIKSMGDTQKVFIPPSFKSVIDLEIDAMIEFGGVMQKCAHCGEYFLRTDTYYYDYCDRISRDGRTCLEMMDAREGATSLPKIEAPPDASVIAARCDGLYKEMSERLNVNMTQRDFSDWYKYLITIRDNVLSGQATMDDFESFVEYSRSISFTPQKPKDEPSSVKIENPLNSEVQTDNLGREIKPFVFEKIDRSQLDTQDNLLYEIPKEFPLKRKNPVAETPIQARVIRVPTPTEGEKLVPYRSLEESRTISSAQKYEEFSFEKETDFSPSFNSANTDISEEVSEKDNLQQEKVDNDVKIYSYEPPVKVFNPKDNRKKRRMADDNSEDSSFSGKNTPSVSLAKPEPLTPSIKSETTVKTESYRRTGTGVLDSRQTQEQTEIISDSESETEKRIETRTQHIVSSYRQILPERHTISERQTITEMAVPVEIPVPLKDIRLNEERKTGTDNKPEIGFTDVLKGIERKDGFVSNHGGIDEPPVSHKTKRVMDALFKPAKPSISLNLKNNE